MQLTDSLGNKLCGTFGCILPNNHKGLHQVTPPRAVPFPKPPARPHHTHTSWSLAWASITPSPSSPFPAARTGGWARAPRQEP